MALTLPVMTSLLLLTSRPPRTHRRWYICASRGGEKAPMDTDAGASRRVTRVRATRLAATWATPLSILAGAATVLWSARHPAARPGSPPAPPRADEAPASPA